jgi:hypothetical protein
MHRASVQFPGQMGFWRGTGNPRGERTAAILSSLTSTCRRHDIDPQLYLTQLLVNLPVLTISQLPTWLQDQ